MTVHDLLPSVPEPGELRRRSRAFAALDAVLIENHQTYFFDPGFAPGVALAQMANGSGDNYNIVFDPAGVLALGFDHESAATPWREDPREHWPGLLDGVPKRLAHHLDEPAFQFMEFIDATVCFWRENDDDTWSCGPVSFEAGDDDGATTLFDVFMDEPVAAYRKYANDYLERDVDAHAVARVLAGDPLTAELVARLDPDRDAAEALAAAAETGFAVQR